MAEVQALQAANPDHVLLVQVGGFYEIYGEGTSLEELSRLLHLVIARQGAPNQCCGFPVHQIRRYTKLLMDAGRTVAVADQTGRDLVNKTKHHVRTVTRIVTPGTMLSDEWDVETPHNNFLLSVAALPTSTKKSAKLGLAWLDVSTGEFRLCGASVGDFEDNLARIQPREVLFDSTMKASHPGMIEHVRSRCSAMQDHGIHISFRTIDEDAQNLLRGLVAEGDARALVAGEAAVLQKFPELQRQAAGNLLAYVKACFGGATENPVFVMPAAFKPEAVMGIDAITQRALDITQTFWDQGRSLTLLRELNMTKTAAGSRLLASRLKSPSISVTEINRRLDLVTMFFENRACLAHVRERLSDITDIERAIQRIHIGKATPADYVDIVLSLREVKLIGDLLVQPSEGLGKRKQVLVEELGGLIERLEAEAPAGGDQALVRGLTEAVQRLSVGGRERDARVRGLLAEVVERLTNDGGETQDLVLRLKDVVQRLTNEDGSSRGDEKNIVPVLDDLLARVLAVRARNDQPALLPLYNELSTTMRAVRGVHDKEALHPALEDLVETLGGASELLKACEQVFREEGANLQAITDVDAVKDGIDKGLDAERFRYQALMEKTKLMEDGFKVKYGVPTDKDCLAILDARPQMEHYLAFPKLDLARRALVTKAIENDPLADVLYRSTPATTATTVKFTHVEWTALSADIVESRDRILQLQLDIFREACESIKRRTPEYVKVCRAIAETDLASSGAQYALDHSCVRPVVNDGLVHDVEGGRHPIVERAQINRESMYVANNYHIGNDARLWLLTGPNMGGKSTFLRQSALMSVIAQAGLYVPAKSATLGIVDKVFARIGASDDLARNRSTFMVEMQEGANILRNATERSFVIMDEVGRGTSTKDGLSLAYGILDHLHQRNKCRCVFSTHYHELAKMVSEEDGFEHVACRQTAIVQLEDGRPHYTYRVEPGIMDRSHGIHCARDAGMPEDLLDVASNVARGLTEREQRMWQSMREEREEKERQNQLLEQRA
ncbi:DNA mismatch repair ATPase msh1 [Thoreauomyces humboldtii]|nr:DNA mismatch repair ATPase msh1 [Thoreauomyces humboldtii]